MSQPNISVADVLSTSVRRIGRKKAADPRDRDYRAIDHIRGIAPTATTAGTSRYHKRGPQLDQGPSSRCVVFAMGQLIQTGPIMQNLLRTITPEMRSKVGGADDAVALDQLLWWAYKYAQDNDEWSGAEPDYYGTSGRAGAKAFQSLGYFTNYFWLNTVDEIANYILTAGPVPVGTDWFTGMDTRDPQGYIHPTGNWRGGHEYLLDGVSVVKRRFRMRQSWGDSAYHAAWLSFEDMAYLLSQGGDALAIAEIRLPINRAIIQVAEKL